MAELQFQSPLSGGPATTRTLDARGQPVFTIRARALTPLRARIVDGLCDCLRVTGWLSGIGMTVMLYAAGRLTPESAGALIFGLYAVYFCMRGMLRLVFRKTTVIRMTVEAISVRGWFGWKHYNRTIRRSFVVLPHDLVQWEQEAIALKRRKAAQRGRVIQPRSYYSYSGHVALIYAGQRVDLAEVFDTRAATPLMTRLQYCDEVLSEAEGKSKGPDDRRGWAAPEPGALQS